jgi:hypothetical protein
LFTRGAAHDQGDPAQDRLRARAGRPGSGRSRGRVEVPGRFNAHPRCFPAVASRPATGAYDTHGRTVFPPRPLCMPRIRRDGDTGRRLRSHLSAQISPLCASSLLRTEPPLGDQNGGSCATAATSDHDAALPLLKSVSDLIADFALVMHRGAGIAGGAQINHSGVLSEAVYVVAGTVPGRDERRSAGVRPLTTGRAVPCKTAWAGRVYPGSGSPAAAHSGLPAGTFTEEQGWPRL